MVAAEFGSNKRERNRRRAEEGDFGVARQRTEKVKGGLLKAMATLKSTLWFIRSETNKRKTKKPTVDGEKMSH